MFRIIVAGGRTFSDYEGLRAKLDELVARKLLQGEEIVIVSGTANGADKLGERYAEERGYHCRQYPAQWDTYGKSAGYKRNALMAENAEALVAFWDGKSRGTMHMINLAKSKGLAVRVIKY